MALLFDPCSHLFPIAFHPIETRMSKSANWFLKTSDVITGPFTATVLRSMAKRGEVVETSEVGQSAEGPWYQAGKVRGLIVEPMDEGVPSLVDESPFEERNRIIDGKAWKEELSAISWKDLFPLASWFRDEPWTLVWVQALVFAFATPLFLLQFFSETELTLTKAAWSFSTYFAVLWGIFLHRLLRPDAIGAKRILGIWFFTSTLGCIAVLVITEVGTAVPVLNAAIAASNQDESASLITRFFGMTIGVGLIEECVKLFPVFWLVKMSTARTWSRNSVIFMGVVSGLAFGATEAIVYSYQYAEAFANAEFESSIGSYIVIQILRFISLPFLHAVWCGISAYFLALSKASQKGSRVLPLVGLCTVALLHGSYNTFSDSWIGFGVTILSMFIFVGYIRTDFMSVVHRTADVAD